MRDVSDPKEISIDEADPGSPDAERCLYAYADELARLFPEGYQRSDLISPAELRSVGGVCLVARHGGEAVGCAILRPSGPGAAEIKHLWVDPPTRGLGVSRRLLAELERRARLKGTSVLRLDTHRVLTEAIQLYRTSGYTEIAPYGDNPHAHHWFEKLL